MINRTGQPSGAALACFNVRVRILRDLTDRVLPQRHGACKLDRVKILYETEMGATGVLDVGRMRPTDTARLLEDFKGARKGDRGRVAAVDTGTGEVVLAMFSDASERRFPIKIVTLTLPSADPRVSSLTAAKKTTAEPVVGVHIVVAEMAESPTTRPIAMALLPEALKTGVDVESAIRWANNRRAANQRRAELDAEELRAAERWCKDRRDAETDADIRLVYTAIAQVLRKHAP